MSLDIKKTVWNLSPLLNGDDDLMIQDKVRELEVRCLEFVDKWKNREDYLTNPKVLKDALDEYQEWCRDYGAGGDIKYYFDLRLSQEMNNSAIKAKSNQITDLSVKLGNEIQFFELNIAKITTANQSLFLNSPELLVYRHFLERLFQRAEYQLSQSEERILNLMDVPARANWVDMTQGFLVKSIRGVLNSEQELVDRNFSEIISLVSHRDKLVRDSASDALDSIAEQYVEVAEAEINSILSEKKIVDELRGWSRPDGGRHLNDDIESEVVDTMIETVVDRFDISKRYYDLKAKLFGFDKLAYHERQVPYGSIEDNYSFKSAAELVNRTLGKLDPEFSEIFLRFLKNGQIDVFPRAGKEGNAFCIRRNLKQPSYVLLNYNDRLSDAIVLAHEMGHAINNELMRKRQNSLNFGSPTSTAEVASTFMEDFVIEELMKSTGDEQRLSLMMMKLDSDISSIFRQVACYRFEAGLHAAYRRKGYLSKDEIGELFKSCMNEYMGESIEQPEFANGWIFWPHIRKFFYVYSYSSGLLISKSLQVFVKNDQSFIANVKEFLATGKFDSPKNIFAKLGIDVTRKEFWLSGLAQVDDLLIETVALAKKLGKI